MTGEVRGFEFSVLLERVYSTDLGKYVEAGTILLPMTVSDLTHKFIIMNEKAWTSHITRLQPDMLIFPFNVVISAQKPLVRSLGPKFRPENPLSEEEIRLFRLIYEP